MSSDKSLVNRLKKPLMAEFVAMTLFVWIGCGAALSAQTMNRFNPNSPNSNAFLISVATAFGLAIAVLAYTIAPISGGHINPAVTLGLMSVGKIDVVSGVLYMVVQFMGAAVGAGLLWGTNDISSLKSATGAPPFLLGSNSVSPLVPLGSAFVAEMIGTFLLVWTVMMTAVYSKSMAGNIAPIAIGWSVLLAHLVLIPLTGCGINPARSFGPHFVVAISGNASDIGKKGWWIFYTAPFVGAVLAAMIAKFLFDVTKEDSEEEAALLQPEAHELELSDDIEAKPSMDEKKSEVPDSHA